MFEKRIDDMMAQQLRDLSRLVRIPSVSRGEPAPGMPFGKEVRRALDEALSIAHELGFEDTHVLDGYCGYIDYAAPRTPADAELFCILTHLDVVPAGKGWEGDPFSGEITEDRVCGRGSRDDKGAGLSALYALAAVRDAGIPMRRRVRILYGCDEEVGSLGIKHYLETEEIPAIAVTPDAGYPCVNSERGIVRLTYTAPLVIPGFCVACGSAGNVIPGEGEAVLPCEAAATALSDGHITVSVEENRISVSGIGGHGAKPDTAHNAVEGLIEALAVQQLPEEASRLFEGLFAAFGYTGHGERFGLDITDASGRTSFVPTVFKADDTGVMLTVDCRHAHSLTPEDVKNMADRVLEPLGMCCTGSVVKPGLFVSTDSEPVATILKVYSALTGKNAEPQAIGGGTYARSMPNTVGVGNSNPARESCSHKANEYLMIEDIRFNTLFMADLIAAIAGEEETELL